MPSVRAGGLAAGVELQVPLPLQWGYREYRYRGPAIGDKYIPTVDTTRPQRKRTTKKHVEKRSGEGDADSGLQV